MSQILKRKISSLKNKRDFDFVFKNSVRIFGTGFALYVTNLATKQRILPAHGVFIGLSVSKKIGCAPKRNLIKRRFRAVIRELCADPKNAENFKNFAVIFVPKENIFDFSFADFRASVQKSLKFFVKNLAAQNLQKPRIVRKPALKFGGFAKNRIESQKIS